MNRTFGERVDRWMLKKVFRAGRPILTLRLIEARRTAADIIRYLQSTWRVHQVTDGSSWASFIPRAAGYKLFGPDAFPELPRVVEAWLAVYRKHESVLTPDRVVNKKYFYNILTIEDLREHPILLNFALSRPVVEAVSGSLRQVPRLHSLGVFFSDVNDTIAGSQLYHVDGDALTQMKCFVPAWGAGPCGGAFTFVPTPRPSGAMRKAGLLKTLSDADVYRAAPANSHVAVTGPAGSGVFVDTSRCLHQGSRAREHSRLVFQFQYVSRPDALISRPQGVVVPGGHLLVTRELAKGMRLENPEAMMFVG